MNENEMYEPRDSVYCYPGTTILINTEDIKDHAKLKEFEENMVSLNLAELEEFGITGNFDSNHFVSIHKHMFEDIYPFAGLFRRENISKDNFRFAEWQYIESELEKLLINLKHENYLTGLDKDALADKLSYYLAELNVLHPFREGNDRSTREFIRQLALKNKYYLNFNKSDAEEILKASIKSPFDIADLRNTIFNCLDSELL